MVDNASTDGSQALVQNQYSWAWLVELPENQGFTGACNAGMETANGEFMILLNNDTEVEPNWIEEVVAAFHRHPEAGFQQLAQVAVEGVVGNPAHGRLDLIVVAALRQGDPEHRRRHLPP